jgi:hypothetical protein
MLTTDRQYSVTLSVTITRPMDEDEDARLKDNSVARRDWPGLPGMLVAESYATSVAVSRKGYLNCLVSRLKD